MDINAADQQMIVLGLAMTARERRGFAYTCREIVQEHFSPYLDMFDRVVAISGDCYALMVGPNEIHISDPFENEDAVKKFLVEKAQHAENNGLTFIMADLTDGYTPRFEVIGRAFTHFCHVCNRSITNPRKGQKYCCSTCRGSACRSRKNQR